MPQNFVVEGAYPTRDHILGFHAEGFVQHPHNKRYATYVKWSSRK
jgi:hypothetical protein